MASLSIAVYEKKNRLSMRIGRADGSSISL